MIIRNIVSYPLFFSLSYGIVGEKKSSRTLNVKNQKKMADEKTDSKKKFWDVMKVILITFGIIIAVVVFVVFIVAYLLIKTVARPICSWGFLQMMMVIVPFIGEIAGYVIAFTGVGLPITGIILVVGSIIETVSSVCDFITGNWVMGLMGLFGTIPIVGLVPQGLRAGFKVFQAIAKRFKR